MGILYFLVNHKKKQYYDLNKFSEIDLLKNFTLEEVEEAVKDFIVRGDNKVYARFVYDGFKCLLPDIQIVDDVSNADEYQRIEEEYECIGNRFRQKPLDADVDEPRDQNS